MAAPLMTFLPSRSVAPAPQGQLGLGASFSAANGNFASAANLFPKQVWVRFGTGAHQLKLGRFEFQDGAEVTPKHATLAFLRQARLSQRLIGSFAWSPVGRSFDGFHYTRGPVTAIAALPTRGAFQVDGWGNLKIALSYVAWNRQKAWSKNQASDFRLFGIYYHDWRRVLKTDNRPLAARQADFGNVRIGTFGGHFTHATGPIDLLSWALWQTGAWGRQDHRAYAYTFEAGYQPKLRGKPWLRAGYAHSSGDKNPGDNRHGTFFQILPTPRPYARFPFYDMVNNVDRYAQLILRPHPRWTITTEAHSIRLADPADFWVLGGGAFQPWTFGYVGRPSNGLRGLANLHDVSVDWRATPKTTLTAYYGRADGKGVPRRIYSGAGAGFGYLELSHRF